MFVVAKQTIQLLSIVIERMQTVCVCVCVCVCERMYVDDRLLEGISVADL